MYKFPLHLQASPVVRNPAETVPAWCTVVSFVTSEAGSSSNEEDRLRSQTGPFLYYFLGIEPE